MTAEGNKTLFVIGIGPGIGRSVTSLFASKRYNNIALIARRPEQLAAEKTALEEAVGSQVNIKTYAVDVVDTDALTKALDDADVALGKPECLFYNAARVLPSQLLSHDVKEIDYDFKVSTPMSLGSKCCKTDETEVTYACGTQINVSALYVIAQRYVPHLVELAKSDSTALPSFIVTSSMLPQYPQPFVFALSLVKAAQRNMIQSLNMTYASEGVNIGLINVGGQVSPEHETWNPSNIADKAWDWYTGYKEDPAFEVII